MTFANVCKPVHDVILIPTSFETWNLENVERKEKNFKNLNVARTKRTFYMK